MAWPYLTTHVNPRPPWPPAQALKDAQAAELKAQADAEALVRAAGGAEEGVSPIDGEAPVAGAPVAEAKPAKVFELDALNTIAIIGYGGFGRITLVKPAGSDETYALKALSKNAIGDDTVRQSHVLAERDALGSVDSRFILKLTETYQDTDFIYFLTDVLLGGDMIE